MLHAVRFINTSSLISGTAYPGMRGQSASLRATDQSEASSDEGQSVPSPPSESQIAANRNLISSRFGFLSCITGFTSICLLGLTLAHLAPKPQLTNGKNPPPINGICSADTQQQDWDHCQIDILLKLLAFIFTFGASVEIQLRRRKNVLLGCSYNSTLSAKLSDVLLLLLTGSSCFSLLALFNFVRRIFHHQPSIKSITPTRKTDMTLVYLSLLFILTLFNLLTTFIYCSKSRHFLAPMSANVDSKQFQDPPPSYDAVMLNEKLFPIEQSAVPGRLTGTTPSSNSRTNTTEFKSSL